MQDYLITFLSILIGYIVTQFFEGWQIMIAGFATYDYYWLHLGWTFVDFVYIIYLWWVFGFFQKEIARNFGNFLIVLAPCFLLYLIANYIFPDSSTINLKDFYYSEATAFFACHAILMFFSTFAALHIFGESPWSNNTFYGVRLLSKNTFYRFMLFSIFLLAAFCQNKLYHIIVFVISCFLLLRFIFNYYNESKVNIKKAGLFRDKSEYNH